MEIDNLIYEPISILSKYSASSDFDIVFEKMTDFAKIMLENTKNYVKKISIKFCIKPEISHILIIFF